MLNIAIVDDDELILDQIENIIKGKIKEEVQIKKYSDSIEFYNNNDDWNYDIIFLDIDMPKMNGFEIAETIGLIKKRITIVFTSNLEHLVYDSLKFKPFRFVRKSKLTSDIISAIDDFISEQKRNKDIFLIRSNGIAIPTLISDIVYFESMGHDIFVKTSANVKYQILRERGSNISMQSLSEQFEAKGFIRVHKSFLVNYKYIYVIKRTNIIMKNRENISINPHNTNDIREKYQHNIMMEE